MIILNRKNPNAESEALFIAIKTASMLKAIDCGTRDKSAIEVRENLKPEGSVKKKNKVNPKKETAAENARSNNDVEKSLERLDSSRAISRVSTRLIPKSAKSDIKPNIERAAEYVPKSAAPTFPAKNIAYAKANAFTKNWESKRYEEFLKIYLCTNSIIAD